MSWVFLILFIQFKFNNNTTTVSAVGFLAHLAVKVAEVCKYNCDILLKIAHWPLYEYGIGRLVCTRHGLSDKLQSLKFRC